MVTRRILDIKNVAVIRPSRHNAEEMAVVPIILGKDQSVLRAQTVKTDLTKETKKLLQNLEDTCIKANGAGLAAPQINRSERVCVAMINKKLVAFINPEITWKSDEIEVAEEGCLSLPDIWVNVPRAQSIRVKYLTDKGREQSLELSDFNARVVQHEVDHLDGKLIVDYL